MEHNFFQISKHNDVEFLSDGPEYREQFIQLIRNAKKIIHLQTYIFWMDEFGSIVHRELINATKRNVLVYVLVDSVGSRLFPLEAEQELREAGVHFVRFNYFQLKWLYSWGRRLHHKVLIVDQSASIVGGINITYNSDNNLDTPQLDFALLLKGPVLIRLTQYCQKIYANAAREKILFPPLSQPENFSNGYDVKIMINDWVFRRWQITKQYAHLAKKAKKEITIINSYFFPRKSFMRELVAAKKRGVKVRLILPQYSDWPNYIRASEYLYSYFLKNDIEIYLWRKSIHHGKLAIIDDRWATIGSFNLNYTSYQQNIEMNVSVYSNDFVKNLNHKIEYIIKDGCMRLDARTFLEKSPMSLRMRRLFYYLVLSVVANFSIGLISQEENKKDTRIFNLLRIIGSLFFFVVALVGLVLPIIPTIPFIILSLLLVSKQIILNKKKET